MGLVIIVLLILLGIFLLLFLGRPDSGSRATSYNQKFIDSFVSTLPEVELDCNGNRIKFKNFIRACLTGGSYLCAGDNHQTCDALKSEADEILHNSLAKWGYEYRFEILKGNNKEIQLHNPAPIRDDYSDSRNFLACKETTKSATAEQPVPIATSGQPALIRLRICYD